LREKNIIIGICGGIAAYKAPQIVRLLKKEGANVKVALTNAGAHFVSELSLATVSQEPIYRNILPPTDKLGTDFTHHISLGEWADALVIAPATANTLAKLATGICDDILTTCFITLRPSKPILIFPAMDGQMFLSHSVQRNIAILEAQGCMVFNPESGDLASGQYGLGRMPEPQSILCHLKKALHCYEKRSLFYGKSIIVTAGPTREKIDGIRYISNYSSGKMGFAIAHAAAKRGAIVTLITGPVHLKTPYGVERIDVESAAEMHSVAKRFFRTCSIFIGTAAVADYRPLAPYEGKMKKDKQEIHLTLIKNPDILEDFSLQKNAEQLAIGFALEVQSDIYNAKKKLEAKKLDLIAFNFFDRKTAGFDVDTNILTLIARGGKIIELPKMTKNLAAEKLLTTIEKLCVKPTSIAENKQ